MWCSTLRLRVYSRAYCFWRGGAIKLNTLKTDFIPHICFSKYTAFLDFTHLSSTKAKWKTLSFFKQLTELLLGIWQTKEQTILYIRYFFVLFTHSFSLNTKCVFSNDNRLNIDLENLRKYPGMHVLSLSLFTSHSTAHSFIRSREAYGHLKKSEINCNPLSYIGRSL